VAIIAAKLKEFLPLLFTLYTFGQNLLAQIVYHDDDRLHEGNGILFPGRPSTNSLSILMISMASFCT